MRTSILKRFATGFMAVAMVAGMFFGMGLSAAPADTAVPSTSTYGGFTIQSVIVDGAAASLATVNGDTATDTIAIPYGALAANDTIVVTAKYTPAAKKYLAAVSGTQVASLAAAAATLTTIPATNDFNAAAVTAAYDGSARTGVFTMTAAAAEAAGTAYLKLGSTAYDLEALPTSAYAKYKITGLTVGAETAHTKLHGNIAEGIIEIPVTTELAIGDKITITTAYTPALGSYLEAPTATQVSSMTGGAVTTFSVVEDYTAPVNPMTAAQHIKISDLAGAKTVKFTFTATAVIAAGSKVYVDFTSTETAYAAADTEFVFWNSVVARRAIPGVDVDKTAKTIKIYYTTDAPSDLWKFTSDKLTETLPSITIGQATAGTSFTKDLASDYYTAVIGGKDGKVKLNGVEYTVTFEVSAIPQVNAANLTNADIKAKMAYTQTLNIGGVDYTYDKATDYAALITGTTLTFNKVTSLTGSGTITFKGAYLYADQSFGVTAAALKGDGVTVTLVYKDGTTSPVTVKAVSTGITKPSATYFGSALQVDTAAIGDSKKRITVLIDAAASTKYPYNVDITKAGVDTISINLVNDIIPATLQVKVESKVISGGSKILNVDFYNQVFPIELTDGSYYYLSVNVSSLKNALLPVSKFDFIGVASLNNDFLPLTTWNTTDPNMNKTLLIDATGVLTDRVTYAGVLADGTTAKIWPSTSYYQPNAGYDAAYWFYARWTVGGTMYGASVKYTRPYVTFDVTDATTNTVCTYSAVFIIARQEMYATAINSTLGGQASVYPIAILDDTITKDVAAKAEYTGDYSQTWKQADTFTQYAKDKTTTVKGKIKITSYYTGTIDLAADYVVMTLRLPKGCTLTMDTTTSDISEFTVLQSFNGVAGNTTTDGLVDYVLKFKYRELYTGSNTVGASTLKVTYPLTNKDNTTLSTTAFKEYAVVTTWVEKAYIAEKKVTMAGITVPDAIVAPSEAATSSVAASSSATSTATSSAATSSTIPVNPPMGVPFNALAYIVTIAASAVGGVSTFVLRRK